VTRAGDLTEGSLALKTFRFGLPLSVALALHGLFNLVDAIIVGRLGEGAIAAVTVAGVIVMVPMLVFEGVCNLTVAYVARARGARRPDQVHDVAWESLVLGGAATVLTAVATPFCAWIVRSSFDLADPKATDDAVAYLEIMMYGAGTMFLIQVVTSVLRGVGDTFWPVTILVGSNLLNLLLNVGLVFGELGFPRLGVPGSAWATVIARGAGALVGVAVVARGAAGLDFRRHHLRRPLHYWRALFLSGLPSSVQLAVRVVALLVLLQIAKVATAADPKHLIDGVGIAIRIEMIPVFIMFGWGAAATTVVGQNLGAGSPARAAAGAWWTVAYAAGTSMLIALLLWIFRDALFRLVMPDIPAETRELGLDYWRITLPGYGVLAVGAVLSRGLNGAGSSRTGLFIDVVCYVLLLMPVAAIVSGAGIFGSFRSPEPYPAGVWATLVGVHVLAGIIYTGVFLHGRWKRKEIHGLTSSR
jgi:putative MATE family efflux protein